MDRRKTQNREAQRRYRENIKRKLMLAERQLGGKRNCAINKTDADYGHGIFDEQDDVDKSCNVDDAVAAFEHSSPGLDFDWNSLSSSNHMQSAFGLLSPSQSIMDSSPTANTSGSTVIHIAARKGYHKIIGILSDSGVDISSRDDSGQTPLHLAAASGHSDTIKALLKLGAEIDVRNHQGHTPLFFAVNRGDDASVKTLLENGADPNAKILVPVLEVTVPMIEDGFCANVLLKDAKPC